MTTPNDTPTPDATAGKGAPQHSAPIEVIQVPPLRFEGGLQQRMADAGITTITLAQTPAQVSQGASSFTQTVAGADASDGNVGQDQFARTFANTPKLTQAPRALAQLRGSRARVNN